MRAAPLLLVLFACATEPGARPDAQVASDASPVGRPDAASAPIDAGPTPLACDPAFGLQAACGGDLVGAWRYVDVCGAPKQIGDFIRTCPAARVVRNSHTVTGTAGFDGAAYGWRLADDFDVALEVPVECTDSVGGCQGFALVVSIGLGEQVSCAERGDLCDCSTMGRREDQQTGTYSVLTGTVTTTTSDGKSRKYYYCVDGDRAMYRRVDDEIVFLLGR